MQSKEKVGRRERKIWFGHAVVAYGGEFGLQNYYEMTEEGCGTRVRRMPRVEWQIASFRAVPRVGAEREAGSVINRKKKILETSLYRGAEKPGNDFHCRHDWCAKKL